MCFPLFLNSARRHERRRAHSRARASQVERVGGRVQHLARGGVLLDAQGHGRTAAGRRARAAARRAASRFATRERERERERESWGDIGFWYVPTAASPARWRRGQRRTRHRRRGPRSRRRHRRRRGESRRRHRRRHRRRGRRAPSAGACRTSPRSATRTLRNPNRVLSRFCPFRDLCSVRVPTRALEGSDAHKNLSLSLSASSPFSTVTVTVRTFRSSACALI